MSLFGQQTGTDLEVSLILGPIHAAEEIRVEKISLLLALLFLLNGVQLEHPNFFLCSFSLDSRALIVLARRAELILKSHGRFQHASAMRRLSGKGIVEGHCRLVAIEPNG